MGGWDGGREGRRMGGRKNKGEEMRREGKGGEKE